MIFSKITSIIASSFLLLSLILILICTEESLGYCIITSMLSVFFFIGEHMLVKLGSEHMSITSITRRV